MADKDIILEVRDLKKYFKSPTGTLHAVDGVASHAMAAPSTA